MQGNVVRINYIELLCPALCECLTSNTHNTNPNMWYHLTVGTGGSPKNWSVWWCKSNKTLLFTLFSAHTQIAFMLMLREHMPCLFATRGWFFMTFLDTFSSQHIETAKPRVFTRHALNCACLKNVWFYCARQRKWLSIDIYNESGALTTWQSAFFLGARESD